VSTPAAPVPRSLSILLAALAMIGPFSIDTYLPAFPAIGESLSVGPVQVQQTLTAFMLPFAFMMLWHGALSDALGRRRVILVGLAVYVAASLFCATATRIEVLWLGRALQGLSCGVGMVVSRAIVRDLLSGPAAQRMMAQISIMFAIAPAIAPVIGGWIHAFFGWQGIFVFMGLFGAALWFATLLRLPETLPAAKRQSLHPVHLWHSYVNVFSNGEFMRFSASLALNFNGMFLYVLSAPVFLIQHLGLTPQGFAWLFAPGVAGMAVGAFISGRLAGRLSPRRTIALGYAIMCVAVLLNIALTWFMPPSVPWAILAYPLYNLGMAVAMPSMQLLALDLYPDKRGMASSCQSVTTTGVNVLTAAVIAPLIWDTPMHLALGMAVFLVLGLIVFMIALRKYRGARRAARAPSAEA
jgi:DHA1 family bicyclomycin/chloramphenicol resistance-like MFS transporter